jgi:hypothetical protein
MPRSLLSRIGYDSWTRLEAAATRRHAEARRLTPNEPLGALYLYGYTIEIRLKTAYYRLTNVPPSWNVETPVPPSPDSPRKTAQRQIGVLLGLANPAQAGHHLIGWATLLADTRALHPLGAFVPVFQKQLLDHAQAAARHWREFLRYRANKPYDLESTEVIDAANWIQRNYRRLWS